MGPELDGLAYCVAAMVDKAAVLKKGNAQPNVALFARFPPYGRDLESNDWIVKQALDMGLMGVIFNGVDNKEQMTRLIRTCATRSRKLRSINSRRIACYAPGNAILRGASRRLSTSGTPTFGRSIRRAICSQFP